MGRGCVSSVTSHIATSENVTLNKAFVTLTGCHNDRFQNSQTSKLRFSLH